jgi:hypothetical protein
MGFLLPSQNQFLAYRKLRHLSVNFKVFINLFSAKTVFLLIKQIKNLGNLSKTTRYLMNR